MPVDTRNKRASVLGIAAAITLTLPLADASVGQPDRQHVAYSYAGIQAANPIPIPDQTTIRDLLVTAPSVAMDVECRATSEAVGVEVTAVSVATSVQVT